MEKRKKFKVSVERTHTIRTFYEIEAPHDRHAEFHDKMHACMDGEIAPSDNFPEEIGMHQGAVIFAEMDPDFKAIVLDEAEVLPEEEEIEEDEDAISESFIKDISDEISIHVCPESGIPFIGDDINQVPIIPFMSATGTPERDALLESGVWEEGANIVYMAWLCRWVNLDSPNMEPLVIKYWSDLTVAAANDEVLDIMTNKEDI